MVAFLLIASLLLASAISPQEPLHVGVTVEGSVSASDAEVHAERLEEERSGPPSPCRGSGADSDGPSGRDSIVRRWNIP